MIAGDVRRAYDVVAAGPAALAATAAPDARLDVRAHLVAFERRFTGRHLRRVLCLVFRRELLAVLVAGLAAAALTVAVPWSLRPVLAGLDQGRAGELVGPAVVVTALMLARLFAGRGQNWLERRLTIRLQVVVQRALLHRLQRVPASYLAERNREPLSYLSGYSLQLTQLVYVVSLLVSGITVATAGAMLLAWSGTAGLLVLGAVAVLLVALRAMIVVIGRLYYAYVDVDHERTTFLRLVATSLASVRRQQLEPQVLAGLGAVRDRQVGVLRRRARWQTLNRTLEDSVAPITALLLVGGTLWHGSVLPVAEIFAALLLVRVLLDAAANGLADYRVLRLTRDPAREIEELFGVPANTSVPPANTPGPPADDRAPGTVELVLPGGDRHTIAPGQRVAVVGGPGVDTGALLRAFLAAEPSGPRASMSGRPALVGRGQPTFDATVAEHVVLWERPVDPARYADAMSRAGLAGELDQDGRVLSTGHTALSEGQAQRLALAQALYCRPDVLLLDDVFAALDPDLAQRVAGAVLAAPATCVYTTSRLELAVLADTVLLAGADGEMAVLAVSDLPVARETAHRLLGADLAGTLLRAVRRVRVDTGPMAPFRGTHRLAAVAEPPSAGTFDTTGTAAIRLRDLVRNVRGLFPVTVLAVLPVVLAAGVLAQLGFATLVDRWAGDPSTGGAAFAVLTGTTAVVLIAAAVRYLLTYLVPIGSADRLHLRLFQRLLGDDVGSARTGRVLGRMTQDFRDLEMEVPNATVSYAAVSADCLLYVTFIAILNPVAFLLLTPLVLAGAWTYRRGRVVSVDAARLSAGVRGPVLSFAGPALGAPGLRLSPAIRDKIGDRFDHLTGMQLTGLNWALLAQTRLGIRVEALGFGAFAAVLWAVLVFPMPWAADVSTVIVFLAASLTERTVAFINVLQTANVTTTQFDRLAELLHRRHLPAVAELSDLGDPQHAYEQLLVADRRAEPGAPAVRVRDVSFAYAGDDAVLEGVSLTVGAGEAVALTGRSGLGKSTLVRLISGGGRITHGAVDLGGTTPEALGRHTRRAVLHLDSDLVAVPTTVRRFLDPLGHAPEGDVLALLDDLTAGPPIPPGTAVNGLSHAQRQCVNLARALLNPPSVLLVLDEATSALDVAHERRALAVVRRRLGTAACLAVMHRPDNLDCFDRVETLTTGAAPEPVGADGQRP